MDNLLVENLKDKWEPVLNCEGMTPIQDDYRRNVTAILLENQEKALREEANVAPVPGASGFVDTQGTFDAVAGFDPVLISIVRRSMPNLIAYDVCGVQPLSGPTGLIFAMKAKFTNKSSSDNPEALFDEAPTQFSATSGGATGGSGVVILRYPSSYTATFSSGVTHVTATIGSDKVSIVTATSSTSDTVYWS